MRANERPTIVGVFRDRNDAERAIDELHRLGFRDDQIGFAVRGEDGTAGATTTAQEGGNVEEGALAGALAGAGIGGIIAAAASLLIPGFGPVIAGGILATILGGAAIGATAGGMLGALIGLGVPEEEARYYDNEFQQGRILVTVKADGRADEAHRVLSQHGAYDVENPETGAPAGTVAGASRVTDQDRESLELREEQLRARTEKVETGEVGVRKEVVTEHQQMEVPIRREEVVVERHPVSGEPARGDISEGEEIRIPVREERVRLEKEPVVYEEVEIVAQEVVETEHVGADVRREEARVEREGSVPVRETGTAGARGWDDFSPQYRQRWQTRYGSSGGRWEDHEPYYRYGYEMSRDPRYRGRSFSEVEPELRRGYVTWGQRYSYRSDDNAWDRFKDSVREAWDDARGERRAA
jgi:uncharacterized protein (TIGR02271 family)